MNIYVASSWRNVYQQCVVEDLREHGHETYDFKNPQSGNTGFHWSEIDPAWKYWTPERFVEGLQHPIAQKGFQSDFDAMHWADVCVLVLPCGRSAHLEAGWMRGNGKPTFVLHPPECLEPELMYLIADRVFTSMVDLLARLEILKVSFP